MAWGTPVETREFDSSTTLATYTWSPVSTIPIGSFLFGLCAANVAATISTVADNSTQAGAANTYVIATQGSGTTTVCNPFYCLATTRAILSTDVITATLGATASRRAGQVWTFVPPGQTPVLDVQAGAAAVSASPLVFGSTGALAEAGELALACMAYKSGGASGFSVPSGYASAGTYNGSGGTVTIVEADIVYKANAGTAAEAPSITMATAPASGGAVGRILTFRSSPIVAARPKLAVVRRTWARS